VLSCLCVSVATVLFAAETKPFEPPAEPAKPEAMSSRYYSELAQIHLKYRVYDKAEECLKKAIELEDKSAVTADYSYQLASLYLEWGKEADAEAMFDFSLEQTPDSSTLLNRSRDLARVYEGRKQYEKAEAIYRKIMAKADAPVRSIVEKDFFALRQKMGKLDDLVAEKEKLFAENPKDSELLYSLSYLYRMVGKSDRETEMYKKLVELNPQDQRALFQLGISYRNAHETQKAVEVYEKLVALSPQTKPYYIAEIVKIYAQDNQQDKADAWLAKMNEGDEAKTPAGHARLARLYQELNILDKSIDEYKASVAGSEDPRQREQYELQLARAYVQAKQLPQAEELCRKLIQETQNQMVKREAQGMLVRTLKDLGRESEAKELQDSIVDK